MSTSVVKVLASAFSWTAGWLEGLLIGLLGRTEESRLPILEAEGPFGELRLAILGRSRRQIAHVLGIPPTASLGFGVQVPGPDRRPVTYWQASTWYYPFDRKEQKAIAIRFVGDRAREVEFIEVP